MARVILTDLMLVLLPPALYWAWLWYRNRYVARHGGEPPRIEQGPWPFLLFLGAVLAFAVTAAGGFLGAGPANSNYVPPHVENGEVVPAHLEPKPHP